MQQKTDTLKFAATAVPFLALGMMRFFVPLFLLVLAGCNEESTDAGLLAAPPYENITDSIRKQPSDAGLWYRRGSLLYQHDKKLLAEADLKKAWQLQPTEQHALSVVTVLIDRNRDTAIQFIEQALQQLPESVSLKMAQARGYQQKGDLQKSLAVCDEVLQSHPNALDAWQLKAEIHKEQGNTPAALAALENAYAYAPFDISLSYELAFSYAETKNPKVLALTDSLIRMDTSESHAEPYYFKGVYYSNLGQTAEALRFFERAIQHDYNFLDAHMDKGTLQYRQKKFEAALQTFQRALTITPSYADAWLWSGKCREALNQKQEAKLDYQRAYGLDKSLTEAKEAANRL